MTNTATNKPVMPAGPSTPTPLAAAAPFWRREPYALFFPLGILLSWIGVGRWFDIAVAGHNEDYLAIYIFHSLAQVQGFLLCFATGFLFTMIPRRTGTWPPSALEMTIGIVAPLLTAVAAWGQHWAVSQVGWLLSCGLLVSFVLRRFLSSSATRRPPVSFVWILVALLLGVSGSILTGAGSVLSKDWMWVHTLGQQFVLQGVFISLVLGVGGLALPMMTRGVPPPDATLASRDLVALAGHLVAAVLLAASFFVQLRWSVSGGLALRAAVITAVLVLGPELWRLPALAGWNRRVIWLSAWCLPAGFAFAAWFPQYYQAGLHLTFIGGFAMLTLAVSTHVVLGHGDRPELNMGQPWQVATIAMLMLAATVARMAMTIQPANRNSWMAVAAVFFLMATVVWAAFLVPMIVQKMRSSA